MIRRYVLETYKLDAEYERITQISFRVQMKIGRLVVFLSMVYGFFFQSCGNSYEYYLLAYMDHIQTFQEYKPLGLETLSIHLNSYI